MATQWSGMTFMKRTAISGIGLVAAVLTIGGTGWWAAVEYYEYKTPIDVERSSVIITNQDRHIRELRQQIADKDKIIAEYKTQVAAAVEMVGQTPTDANWVAINEQLLCLVADILKTSNSAFIMKDTLRSMIKLRREGLTMSGLMASEERDGVDYLRMVKYPQGRWINLQTGELVDPKE